MRHSLRLRQEQCAKEEVDCTREQQQAGIYPPYFPFPIGLQFELTSKCNLCCKHCYNSSGTNHYKDTMTVRNWKELAHNIVEQGGIFQAIMSGGEPLLLGKDLFEIMDIFHEDGTAFIVITNGMLVTKEVIKNLLKYNFFWIQVSIDDLHAERHDKFRGAFGSWEKAVNAAFMMSSAGLPLRIAHSVTPENVHDLEGMIDFSYKLGASSIVCGAIMPSGRAALAKESLVPSNQDFMDSICNTIEKMQKKYAGKMAVLNSADPLVDIYKKKSLPNSTCVVRPNGDLRMDCTMPFIIGNIHQQSIKEIWQKKGITCWNSQGVTSYISKLDQYGNHPSHQNHIDLDMKV